MEGLWSADKSASAVTPSAPALDSPGSSPEHSLSIPLGSASEQSDCSESGEDAMNPEHETEGAVEDLHGDAAPGENSQQLRRKAQFVEYLYNLSKLQHNIDLRIDLCLCVHGAAVQLSIDLTDKAAT